MANDSGKYAVLVLLDLTAAFDAVDHKILLNRLQQLVGIGGSTLDWFRSHLGLCALVLGLVNHPLLRFYTGSHRAQF